MVKEADKANLTAAIGDGGNDVSMIQEANLGLGIIGVEGDAAAKAADFSFAKVSGTSCNFYRATHLVSENLLLTWLLGVPSSSLGS